MEDLAAQCQLILLCLPDGVAVRDATEAMAPHLQPGEELAPIDRPNPTPQSPKQEASSKKALSVIVTCASSLQAGSVAPTELSPGSLVVDHSTTSPQVARNMEALLGQRGASGQDSSHWRMAVRVGASLFLIWQWEGFDMV